MHMHQLIVFFFFFFHLQRSNKVQLLSILINRTPAQCNQTPAQLLEQKSPGDHFLLERVIPKGCPVIGRRTAFRKAAQSS